MKKKLLLFATHQFGYLTDTLKYCQYISEQYEITYLGWDYGKTKVTLNNVEVKYVSREGNLWQRNYRLLKALHEEVRSGQFDLVFTHYTRAVSLVKLLNRKQPFVFDIRTGSTDKRSVRRIGFNAFMKLESLFFQHITVISDGLAAQLGIRKYSLLPLGADTIAMPEGKPAHETLNLLYVGTLQNRNILTCVKGLQQYIEAQPDKHIRMTIVGDSPGQELREIRQYIKDNDVLREKVICTGRVLHGDLNRYFSEADAGLSFIPVIPWYEHQPPTKTYEYLLSGLPVIATRTQEHIKLLEQEDACVLINDTADDFARALTELRRKLPDVAAVALRERYIVYSWESIVRQYFIPAIESVN